MEAEMKTIKDAKTFDELLDIKYGKVGTPKRDEFDNKSKAFMIGELIKDARLNAKITQEQLAEKTGTKKSYISRVENGKIDIQLSTLYRILEEGLGRHVNLTLV
jgi:ribosome-binding protein aMBF1 (putative translation factor)